MFDHRSGGLRPGQPPAKCAVNDASVAQGLKGLLSYGSPLSDRRARQHREFRACLSEVSNKVLYAADSTLDRLDPVVCLHVLCGVEGFL